MSKRAEEAASKAYPDKVFRYKKIGDADGVMTGESIESQQYIRDYFIEGYEQAEKDIWAAIEKYLSKLDTSDFATVGWIFKHLDEYKKAIMEED